MSELPTQDQQDVAHHRGLGPPRFRLLTLLGVVTAISVILAVYTSFGGFAASLVALFLLAVFAHVAGNWLGNQLRDLGTQERHRPPDLSQRRPAGRVEAHEFAEATRLGERQPISWWVKVTVGIGSLLGAVAGGTLLIVWNDGRLTWLSFAFGTLAFAVLGAIWTFAFGAFCHVGWTAWRQAARFDRK